MSTRTSIRIGTLLDGSMMERLPGYTRVLEEYTNQYLLFGYRKPILGHYHAMVLFQASKSFGGITCEVALSRTEEFPYYRYYDQPRLGVSGFRARTAHVLKGLESTSSRHYNGPEKLMGHILDLVSEAIKAGNKLIEECVPIVAEQFSIWQPHFEEWRKAHQVSSLDAQGCRYPELVGEAVSRKIILDTLRSGIFDGYLGPKKFRYRDKAFMDCHVYLLAKALAFEEPPEPEEFKYIVMDPEHDPEKILFDAIGAISGRLEQEEAIQLSDKILERVPQWCFLRSFAALEALFDAPTVALDEVLHRVKEPEAPKEDKPVGMSLDELYTDSVELGGPLTGAAPTAPQQPQAKIFKLGKERFDPFDELAAYVDGKKRVLTKRDAFDLLGSQFGL